MNRLQLCQRFWIEAGLTGTGPATTISQSGDLQRSVLWIDTAYEDIQNKHATWQFLQSDFNFTTTADKREYTPAEAGITDFESWKVNKYGDMRTSTDATLTDEQYLEYMYWSDFNQTYLFGATRATTGRPTIFTVRPNKSLVFYQIPTTTYRINGQYFKSPDVMALDADVPVFDSHFHLAIVWRALMFYGAFDAADERYTHGQNEYKKLIKKLEFSQLDRIRYGAPLV